jgi:hypothetical protein
MLIPLAGGRFMPRFLAVLGAIGHMRVEVDLESGQVISVSRPRNTIDVCEQLGGHAG